jgi:hypothetical protein
MDSYRHHLTRILLVIMVALLYPRTGLAEHSDTEVSTTLAQLVGVWSSEGYGQVLEFQSGQFDRYEITNVSCLLVSSGSLGAYQNNVARVLRNADNTRFSYILPGNLTTYAFNRLNQLPARCRNGGTGPDTDPLANFDLFWATFNEQYAFFAERGVNWNALRNQMRPRLNGASSDEDLFEVLVELVTPLCDAHVQLTSDFADFNGGINPTCFVDNRLFQEILLEFDNQTQFSDPFEYYQQVFRPNVLQLIEEGYLQGSLTSAARSSIHWGNLGAGVGYLGILQMTNYANANATPEEDLQVLAPILDQALASFLDKDALVIDIRLNTGGYDHVALDLADRFADQSRVAFTKKARWGDGFTDEQPHLISSPGALSFTRPIVILTSELTASAAENFLLAMRSMPHVTIIGEATVGVHSDVFERQLPNGWRFSLSNEIYESPDGSLFEGRGIEPDIEVEALRAVDRSAGRDAGIEAALEQLATGSIDPGLRGTWWNPDRAGEGYLIDFLVFGASRHVFVTFYTYDANGRQAYLVGSTDNITNPLRVDMGITEGGIFGPNYDPQDQSLAAWGSLTIEFNNCLDASVTLSPSMQGFEAYSTSIERFGESPFETEHCP